MSLNDPAAHLRAAGVELTAAATALAHADPAAGAFGAGATGRLGDLVQDLHRAYQAALAARIREAVAHGARLSATADAVDRAAGDYAEADRAAAGRHREAT
jgi:hypothetical protein